MDLFLAADEYNAFFDAKAAWHDELERLRPSTKTRIRQVLFQMLREAEITSGTSMIIPALFTADLVQTIATEDTQLLRIFPLSDMDIETWLK